MGSVAAPVLLALAAALAVLALSALVSARRPVRELLTDARDALRGGLSRDRWTVAAGGGASAPTGGRTTLVLDRALRADRDDDEDVSVGDLFDIGRPDPHGYVRADRLASALERAQGAVVGGVQQVQHRVRR